MSLAALLMLLQAATGAEDVAAPTPPVFVSAFNATQGAMRIEERIPRGETVERWTRMITIQRLGGAASVGGAALLERIAGGFAQACAGSTATPVETRGDSARIRIDCPLNPATGNPETMFARVFTGTTDLLSVQYAFRSVPTAAQVAQAEAYLAGVTRCGGTAPACATPG